MGIIDSETFTQYMFSLLILFPYEPRYQNIWIKKEKFNMPVLYLVHVESLLK
jgi:hypothetical protein